MNEPDVDGESPLRPSSVLATNLQILFFAGWWTCSATSCETGRGPFSRPADTPDTSLRPEQPLGKRGTCVFLRVSVLLLQSGIGLTCPDRMFHGQHGELVQLPPAQCGLLLLSPLPEVPSLPAPLTGTSSWIPPSFLGAALLNSPRHLPHLGPQRSPRPPSPVGAQ